jgi:hypothetical protein
LARCGARGAAADSHNRLRNALESAA